MVLDNYIQEKKLLPTLWSSVHSLWVQIQNILCKSFTDPEFFP